MKRSFPVAGLLFLALAVGLRTTAQTTISDTITTQIGPQDTLIAQVAEYDHTQTRPTSYGETRDLLTGATRDLRLLDVHILLLHAGQSLTLKAGEDHLLIIHEGNFSVTIDAIHKILSPGGVGLFTSDEAPILHNTGSGDATGYLFSFRSRDRLDHDRAKQAGGPLLLDWSELPVKKTDKGESRPIFSRPTGWLDKIDMHATTLDPGQISHPQHVHRAEEIILLRSGNVRMHIAGGYQKASAGDLVFLPSGVPHNLENSEEGRCEYFALQWEQ